MAVLTQYQWDPSLETGNELIDGQHKEWMKVLNSIIDAHKQGKGRDEIMKTMDFLSDYTLLHFSAEEKLMADSDYPEYSIHKRYHEELKETMKNLTKKYAREVSPDDFISIVIYTLGDWLFSHIKGDDFRMAAYIRSKS